MFFANTLTKATKILAVWVFLLFAIHQASAQNEYNIWYFGNYAGLSFNSSGCHPVAVTDNVMYSLEASSGICDSAGNLLFYTNGDTVFNRLHQPMKNGAFFANYYANSSSQGAMVLPVPGSKTLYYLFSPQSSESILMNINGYLRYSIIDMSKDSGLGDVILATQPLLPTPRESMAIAQHANGLDYWITSMNKNNGTFTSVRTVNGAIDPTVYSQPLVNYSDKYMQVTKFSPDSRFFKGPLHSKGAGSGASYYFDLYKFNNTTGQLSDCITIPLKSKGGITCVEFSSDSRYLYVADEVLTYPYKITVMQYDLSVWQQNSIINSAKTISSTDRNVFTNFMVGMQMGPDGKIYVFHYMCDSVSVINYPDFPATDCGYQHKPISLGGRLSLYSNPYYPNFWFKNRVPNCGGNTVSFCAGDSAVLEPKFPPGANILWNTGEISAKITVKKAGMYIAKISYGSTVTFDTTVVTVKKPFVVYLGPDTAFCKQFSHLLDAGKGAKNYLWNTGDTTVTKLVNQPGMYAVTIKDSNSCENGDTIVIGRLLTPKLSLEKDTVGCKYVSLSVDKQDSSIKYLWSTGDTTQTILVNKKGNYLVTASNLFCSITSSITVDALPAPELNLGQDTGVCEGNSIELDAGKWDSYQWNTGQNVQRIIAVKEGNYWVTVTHNGCKTTDTITLYDKCDMWYFIPNAFLPNGHEINNGFHVTGGSITELTLQIFDRWGELIYTGSGLDASWDGTYKSKPCPDGAYMYIISVKGLRKGRMVKENISGVVTLLR